MNDRLAPDWTVARWFNSATPLALADLRGKVVAVHAFQMLCPGCVSHGLPQAQKIAALFPRDQVAVIGLHTVFEHHAAMTPVALEAFLHEYRVTFPVGVDQPDGQEGLPVTMRTYGMRGTPTLLLIDRQGRLREHAFGQAEDMAVGAAIARLAAEPGPEASDA
ncbi:MAG: redoxin domain-containing protein [Alphaproteobacteria bacterium]|nr:redoxin domain-containing protein [Alphaproteobacteria bacterium]